MATMARNRNQPVAPWWPSLMDHRPVGNWAAIWVKISTDMPLPTPRSVISSPSHMITTVPAVMVSTIVTSGKSSTFSWRIPMPLQSGSS